MTKFEKLNSFWDFNDAAKSESVFRKAFDEIDDKNSEYALELRTQIARALGLQMKFDESLQELSSIENDLNDNYKIPKTRFLLEKGRVYNSSGNKENSIEYFESAYELAKENNLDYLTVDAAHMLGIVCNPKTALKWNDIAIKHAEDSKDNYTKKWLGSLYNNTAWTYHDLGEFEKALELFELNVKWHEENKSVRGLQIAKWCVARTLRSLKKPDEALQMQLKLKEEIKNSGEEQDGYVFEEIGECLLEQRKPQEAKEYFAKAYELLSKDTWLQKNESTRLERLKELS